MISARNFEQEIFVIITHLVSDDETVDTEHIIGIGGQRADIFLEKGCKKLGLPSKSLIEIKYILRYDTLSKIAFVYKESICHGEYQKLLIICKENLLDIDNAINKFGLKGRLEIWTFEDLKNKIHFIDETRQKTDATVSNIHVPSVDIIESARNLVSTNKVTLFLGAGVSMDANLPSWNKLLEALLVQNTNMPFEFINEANTDAIAESLANSSIVTGRYIINGFRDAIKNSEENLSERVIDDRTQQTVTNRIREALYRKIKGASDSELVKTIVSIATEEKVKQIITYNYDDLIEHELANPKEFMSIYDETIEHIDGIKPIFHVHGYIPRKETLPEIPVLSEKEYHKLYSRTHYWANVVQLNALYTTMCFFIGFSMTDPNQRRLLDLARNVDLGSIDAGKAKHYILMRRQNLKGEAVRSVNDEHCREIENMMFELGLNVIWFDKFENLPKCLSYIFGKTEDKPKMLYE